MRGWHTRIGRHAAGEWRSILGVLALMIVGVGLTALAPWPLKLILDHVLADEALPAAVSWLSHLAGAGTPPGLLVWLAASTIGLYVLKQLIGVWQQYLQTGSGDRMVYRLGSAVFEHLQRLSLRFHGRKPTGDLVQRVTRDSNCVRALVMGIALPVLTSVANLVIMFAIMWQIDPNLSLLAILVAPLLGVMIRWFSKPMAERAYEHHTLEGEWIASAERTLTALPVVQGFGREKDEGARFRELADRTVRAQVRSAASGVQFRFAVGAITAIGTAAIMVVGGSHVLSGALSIGGLLVFLAYLASLYAPLETLAYASEGFAEASASARRILDILGQDDEVKERPGAVALAPRRGVHVRIEGVTFGYETGRPVLRDVTLDARPGETLALVGHTGSGKSTLVSLLPRLYDPWEGRITLDGHNARDLQVTSLRENIALVPQEPFLLPLSVAENIAYARPEATREEIEAAATAANADEFIRRLPDGYDTVLSERAASLSGGEKQRLAIARAILKDAPVVILDEPTSALDVRTEAAVVEALERLMEGRTTFIIAHRLSTIRRANRVAVLLKGQLVEAGSHQELMDAEGYYREFHDSQATAPSETSARLRISRRSGEAPEQTR